MAKIQMLIFFTLLSHVTSETCPSIGDVRVINNDTFTGVNNSYLQICLDTGGSRSWSYICSQDMNGTNWSNENRFVWCRSRGIPYQENSPADIIGEIDSGELKLTNVSCNRTVDAGLIDCNYTTTYNACRYLHGLDCAFCTQNSSCNSPGFCNSTEGTCHCRSPCMNREFCNLGRCQCRYPYEGDSCQYQPCEEPCSGNSMCNNSTGMCVCKDTYVGPNCDQVPCLGKCSSREGCNPTTGLCECQSPYFGLNCTSKNCSSPCPPVNYTCDYSNGICISNRTDCTNCSNCTDNCNDSNMSFGQLAIYIGISVGTIFVLILCIIVAASICCVVILSKNSKRNLPQNNAPSVENGSVLTETTTNTIEMSQMSLKSNLKLKANTTYIQSKNLSKGNIPHELHLDSNEQDAGPPSPDLVSPNQKYARLSSSHYYSHPDWSQESTHSKRISKGNDYEEVYKVFLNGERSEEQLYEIYSKINESALPSRNATIVLSQEERNSVNLQREDAIIYETCIRQTGRKDTNTKFFLQTVEYCEPPRDLPKIFDRMSSMRFREINPDTLTKQNFLGSGEFGTVHKGTWKTDKGTVEVAMKVLNESSKDELKTAFMKEAAIMGQFSHPNILGLLGILSLSDPFIIVTELMKAELLDVLVSFKTSGIDLYKAQQVLLKFCREICDGMKYLASKKCVHRDLAARNVLLTKNMICKIADFGMSREFKENYDYYKSSGGVIPVKWTSPEAIFYQKYTEKSDVWSFGMTMFEIWSFGYKPWHDKSNQEILEMMQAQEIISPPTGCPQDIYEVMLETWKYDVEERYTFAQTSRLLERNFEFKLNKSNDPQHILGNDPSLVKDFH